MDMNKCLDDSTTGYGSVKAGCTSGRTQNWRVLHAAYDGSGYKYVY